MGHQTLFLTQSDLALVELLTITNDLDAVGLFRKGGPLAWFSPENMLSLNNNGSGLPEKQIAVVRSVYRQYLRYRGASRAFQSTTEATELTTILYKVIQEREGADSKKERFTILRLRRVIREFRIGVVHIGLFNRAEHLIGSVPLSERTSIWESLHSARRAYLKKIYELDQQGAKKEESKDSNMGKIHLIVKRSLCY